MKMDLILKDIKDEYSRENFVRIKSFVQNQAILRGEWRFYEIEFTRPQDDFEFPHGLNFQPKDVIVTSITDQESVIFNYDSFDQTNLNLTVSGACTIRFFAGSYMET